MKRALVTGFEPFGPYKFNPTQDIVRDIDKRVGGIEIVGLVLPCTYYGAFEILSKKIDELSPDIILSTGLASRVPKIRLEALGRNVMHGKYPDANGLHPDHLPLVPEGKQSYATTVNTVALADRLYAAHIPAEISVDAEGFICNSLVYLTARRIHEETLHIKHAFFHTPWTDDYVGKIELEQGKTTIKKQDLRKTVELLLGAMGHS